MGQKVSPTGLRIGVNKDWESKWVAPKKDFAKYLNNDIKIREYLEKILKDAGVSKIEIERNSKKCEVIIHTSKPGVIIGRGGEEIKVLKDKLSKLVDENVQVSFWNGGGPVLPGKSKTTVFHFMHVTQPDNTELESLEDVAQLDGKLEVNVFSEDGDSIVHSTESLFDLSSVD